MRTLLITALVMSLFLPAAVSAKSCNIPVNALKAVDLMDVLRGFGSFTVLAPAGEAFAKLPTGKVESLREPEKGEKLQSILTYHVIQGRVMASGVVKMGARVNNSLDI